MRLCAVSLALMLFALPIGAEAQGTGKVSRIGFLLGTATTYLGAFHEGLRELGYVEGRNIIVEVRSSGGKAERFHDLAAELVGLKVEVIVAIDNPAIEAAKKATRTTPIVMVLAMDPVASGFVGSLARPEGTITGLSFQSTELQGKALQLLKEIVPTASRVGVLWDSTEPGRLSQAREAAAAGPALGLQVQLLEVRSLTEIDRTFAPRARDRLDAVLVHPSQMMAAHRERVAELAIKARLPTLALTQWYPNAGGLMSYGPSYFERYKRAAYYVDRLLRGAKAADLPVEQPTRFELVINLRTARALGLKMPPSVLLRADHVIE